MPAPSDGHADGSASTHDEDGPIHNRDGCTSLHVPPGWTEESGYVRAHRVRLPVADRMALGDLREKYEMLMGENHWRPGFQLSPPPKGYWEEDPEDGAPNFVILDGRHRVIAAILCGYRHLLVRWNAPPEEASDEGAVRASRANGRHPRGRARALGVSDGNGKGGDGPRPDLVMEEPTDGHRE